MFTCPYSCLAFCLFDTVPLPHFTFYYYDIVFFLKIFIFVWRIIDLQYCDGFCHTSIWISQISHMYTYVSPILNCPHLPLHPIPLGHYSIFLLPIHFQFSSVAQSCPTLCDPMNCSMPGSLSITNPRSSLKLMSTESEMPSSHLILCHPLLLLPPIPPSIRFLSNKSTLHMRWWKYWSFSFSITPCKEHTRTDLL